MHLGQDRGVLIRKYQAGVEYCLSKADYLNSTDLMTLQAFTIYVVCAFPPTKAVTSAARKYY